MSISFSLPAPLEDQLRARVVNIDQTAKEAALVELYRLGKLSHGELAMGLEMSRDEVDGLLQRFNVTEDLITVAEFEEQAGALRKLMPQ